jgi:hypothetical protein
MAYSDEDLFPTGGETPNDPYLLKELVRLQNEVLGMYVVQLSVLRESNADLRRQIRHLETVRSDN